MDARSFSRLPQLSVSSGTTGLIRVRGVAQIAAAAGVPAISLDLSSLLAQTLVTRQPLPTIRVTWVWLGSHETGVWTGPRRERYLGDLVQRLGPEAVALDVGGADGKLVRPGTLIRRLEHARRHFGLDVQWMMAIRARQLRGGRQHLADLTALRHLAEEWDFGIALDLAHAFDPTWEAEAAVFRLGNHLKLIRARTTATDRLAVGQARVVARAIAAAVDQASPPEISLVPTVSLMQRASPSARPESIARAARAINRRVVSIESQRAQFLDQGLWPNLRG